MHKVCAICRGMGNNGIFEKRNLAFNMIIIFFFLENWVLRYLIIIFTGIGLHDRIMKTTEKISVEPGSYLAEYRLSITV